MIRDVTNVVRTCGQTRLLLFDFMSNEISLNKRWKSCPFRNKKVSHAKKRPSPPLPPKKKTEKKTTVHSPRDEIQYGREIPYLYQVQQAPRYFWVLSLCLLPEKVILYNSKILKDNPFIVTAPVGFGGVCVWMSRGEGSAYLSIQR